MTTDIAVPKNHKVIYWTATILFVLFESGGSLFFNTPMARAGIASLGFPFYFGVELALGKIIGGILLVIPMVSPRVKEWVYTGFGISLISAFIANLVVEGFVPALFPIVIAIVFLTSYVYYHKIIKK